MGLANGNYASHFFGAAGVGYAGVLDALGFKKAAHSLGEASYDLAHRDPEVNFAKGLVRDAGFSTAILSSCALTVSLAWGGVTLKNSFSNTATTPHPEATQKAVTNPQSNHSNQTLNRTL